MNPLYLIPTSDRRVRDAVSWLQSNGAPKDVDYFDGDTTGPFSIPEHLVTFKLSGHDDYTVIAGFLSFPFGVSVTYGEMRSRGLI